ncbi:hypothetical protein HMPREF1869_01224 [Bacteroidales bacterium KA00251]|nr:hypothetical protein HMPREF1869_01224 [Bacteroidales bacterium KA00251]
MPLFLKLFYTEKESYQDKALFYRFTIYSPLFYHLYCPSICTRNAYPA